MTTIATNIERPGAGFAVDPPELAAIAFLAGYSGRTLDAYRHDLRFARQGEASAGQATTRRWSRIVTTCPSRQWW